MSRILLDSKEYVLKKPLRWMSIAEWGSVVRTTAEQRRSDRSMAADWVIEDLQGGMGLYQHQASVAPQRYYYGDCWTLAPGKIMLPPLINATAATGYTGTHAGVEGGNLYFLRWLKGKLYAGGTDCLIRWTGTAWEDVEGTGFPADFQPRDALTYWDGSNEYIVIVYDIAASSNSAIIKSTTGDKNSWTAVAVSAGQRPSMVIFDSKLVVLTTQNIVSYTTDLTTFTSFRPIPPNPAGKNLAVWSDASGRPAIHICTKGGVFVLDFYAQIAMPASGLSERLVPWEYNGIVFQPANSFLWLSGMQMLARISSGGTGSDVGPWLNDGLPSVMTDGLGVIWDLVPFAGLTLITMWANDQRSSILAHNGSGWHPIIVGAANNPILKMAVDETESSTALTRKLYFTYGAEVKYVELPINSLDPSTISTFAYGASGFIYTPYWDGNLSELTAGVFKIYTRGKGLSANETLTISYATDYADSDTALSAITGNSGSLTYASGVGISAEAIRYKLALARGGTTTNTPIIKFVNTKVLKQAEAKSGWEASIDLRATSSPGRDAETVRAEIETLFGNKTNTTLQYAGATKYVQVMSYQGLIDVGGDEGLTGFDIGGTIDIRLAEVA